MKKYLDNKTNYIFIGLFVIVSILILLPELFQNGFIFSRNIVFTPVMYPSGSFNFLNIFDYILFFLSRVIPAQFLEKLLLILCLIGAQISTFLLTSRVSKRPFLNALLSIAYIATPITFSLLINYSTNFLIIFALTPTFIHLSLDLLEDEYKEEELYKIFVLLIIGFFIAPESTVLWGVTLAGLLTSKLVLERRMETRVISYTFFVIAACYILVSFLQTFTEFKSISTVGDKSYTLGNFPFNLITLIIVFLVLGLTFVSARNFIRKSEASKIGIISIISASVLLGISFISNIGIGRFFPPITLLYSEIMGFTLWILILIGSLQGFNAILPKLSKFKNSKQLKLKKEIFFVLFIILIVSPIVVFKTDLFVSANYPAIYDKVNETVEPNEKILVLSLGKYLDPKWLTFAISDPASKYFKATTIRNNYDSEDCSIGFKSDSNYGDESEYNVCFTLNDNASVFKMTLENLQIKYIFVYQDFYGQATNVLRSDLYTVVEEDENALLLRVY